MTLVAGLSIGGAPAFVADLLTSWSLANTVSIPSQRAAGIFQGAEGYFAKGLAQKITIVRPYLLLAYAGNLSVAKKIISELDAVLPAGIEEIRDHEDLFLAILDRTPDTIEMVALYFTGDRIHPFCLHTRGYEIEGKRLYILGSDQKAFFDYAVNAPGVIPTSDNPEGLMARAVMMRFAANAMMSQWASGYGLSSSWGGGFEVAFTHEDGFRKVDNILFRAWSLGPSDDAANIGVSFLQHYEGGDLHLTSFYEEAVTTIVPSLVPSATRGPSRTEIIPEWTVDLIYSEQRQSYATALQLDPPGSESHARFEFESGKLVAWEMDKTRLAAVIKRMAHNIENGQTFAYGPLPQ
jgi:hypothetical protein